MSLKKFRPNDIIINTMKAHPKSEFFIYNSQVYYNNIPALSGAFTGSTPVPDIQGTILCTSGGTGFISLYEYNIDRSSGQGTFNFAGGDEVGSKIGNHFIEPFIVKGSSGGAFRSVVTGSTDEWTATDYGDVLYGKYPMSASITREYMHLPCHRAFMYSGSTQVFYNGEPVYAEPQYPHFWALKNAFKKNETSSPHFAISSSFSSSGGGIGWDKCFQSSSLISIPSIFYGSQIKPGSVALKMFYTGSLIGELKDSKRNGELIQVTGTYAGGVVDDYGGLDSVAGVVMYNEGFMFLTGNWNLIKDQVTFVPGEGNDYPKWRYFGAGCNDNVNTTNAAANLSNMAFKLSFEGTTETQVMTMYTHARKGEVNYSNNTTFIERNSSPTVYTSSYAYEENPQRLIKNFVSASQYNQSASFQRQVVISKVAIYDNDHNLIGIASLANPVVKKEDEDLAFKIKLDI